MEDLFAFVKMTLVINPLAMLEGAYTFQDFLDSHCDLVILKIWMLARFTAIGIKTT